MIELLIALFLKFWIYLFGIGRSLFSALPFLRQLRLTTDLHVELDSEHLIITAGKRDFFLENLRLLAMKATHIECVFHADLILSAGQLRKIEIPKDTHQCVLLARIVDLKTGRQANLHRRLAFQPKTTGNTL